MKAIVRRLRRLEGQFGPPADRRIVVQHGYLKELPASDTGERHIVVVRQLPPDANGHDWYEWEERPGPDPAGEANPNVLLIRACYVDVMDSEPAYAKRSAEAAGDFVQRSQWSRCQCG